MRALLLPLACTLAACAAPPATQPVAPAPSARLVTLPNADLEADWPPASRCAPRWGCTSHGNPDSHRFSLDEAAPASGKRSLCIERVKPEPWALATLAVLDPSLRGTRARFTLRVRVEGADGPGGGVWVLLHGPSGNLHHDQRLVTGRRGWETLSIEFDVPANARIVEVGGTLEGPGRMCLDDARLEILGPAKSAV